MPELIGQITHGPTNSLEIYADTVAPQDVLDRVAINVVGVMWLTRVELEQHIAHCQEALKRFEGTPDA